MRNNLKVAILALAAGLLGGLVSRNVALPSVHAQAPMPNIPREIRAQSFTLTDDQGRVLGTFTARVSPVILGKLPPPSGAGLPAQVLLLDSAGHQIWSASSDPFKTLSQLSK